MKREKLLLKEYERRKISSDLFRFDIRLYRIQLTHVKDFFDSKVKRIKVKKINKYK